MKILPISVKSIKLARQIIKRGGLVIYPTETVYGLGADISDLAAVKKIFVAKGRNFNKPLSVMVASLADLRKLVYLNKKQETIVNGLLPGPFTLILRKKRIVFNLLTGGSPKVGIRWSPDRLCQQLTRHLPITATSANLSNQGNVLSIKKLAKDFSGRVDPVRDRSPQGGRSRAFGRAVSNGVDLILTGKKMGGQPSRVIDLTTKPFKILR